jgi:serine/threonine-protein kinase
VGGERFLAEIRTTAKLQHPHILSLFDSGDAASVLYYVMPYLEGESLQDRLERETQLPVSEAVRIARDVADAIQFAHDQGVVHRDIKPGNILLKDGRAFVADFGIALALREAGSSRLTETGTRLGTPLYMSPEQATGDGVVDGRTDIYAVGCVLYEMLVGEPPFTGSSAQQILAKIVVDEARPLRELRSAVPRNVEAAVGMALQKLPADRFQSAGALAEALVDERFRADTTGRATTAPDATTWKRRAMAGLVTTVALVLVAAWGWLRPTDPGSASAVVRAMVETASGPDGLALSPDGRTLAYTAVDTDGTVKLWIHPLEAAAGRPLEGTDGADGPFWSPDGESLGFFAEGSLKRVPVAGGPVVTLAPAESSTGGAWGADERIVYAPIYSSGLFEVSADGGQPRVLTELDAGLGEKSHRWPRFLPDGRELIFLAQTAEHGAADDRSRVDVLDAEGRRHELVSVNSSAAFASGHLLYWRGGALYAHAFDVAERRVDGTPRLVVDGVAFDGGERAGFSVSPEGTLVYRDAEPPWRLEWRDRTGRLLGVEEPEGQYTNHELSPGGGRVAYREGRTLWVRDLVRGTRTRLTFEDDDHRSPTWSPDGDWIAYTADRTEGLGGDVYRVPSSGGGAPEHLFGHDTETFRELRWSDDGRQIVFMMTGDLYILDLTTGQAEVAVATPGRDRDGSLSPNGRWLAFTSDESGRPDVFVAPVGESTERWPISQNGGFQPVWSGSGEELLFFGLDYELNVVSVEPGAVPEFGVPEPMFTVSSPGGGHRFQIAPDGRVLLRTHEASGSHQNPRLILGWPELLGQPGG